MKAPTMGVYSNNFKMAVIKPQVQKVEAKQELSADDASVPDVNLFLKPKKAKEEPPKGPLMELFPKFYSQEICFFFSVR